MKNILDYVAQERRSFSQHPFNAVDALVLSCLAYQDMPDMVPGLGDLDARYGTIGRRLRHYDLAHPVQSWRMLLQPPFPGPTLVELDDYLEHHDFVQRHGPKGLADPHLSERLYALVGRSPRFGTVTVTAFERHFSVERQTQFAAETFRLPDGTLAIVFQGTDDSFVGWKEDFNMAFQYPIPAQESALAYVETVSRLWKGPLLLMGHSKGGNLAVYATIHAPAHVRSRIRHTFCLDGPGFPKEVVDSKEYQSAIGIIDTIVPSSSIVGMILETPEPCIVVQSNQRGIMQHLAFSWQVENGDFVRLPSISPGSQYFNTQLNTWLRQLSPEQRRRSVDALFSILDSTETYGFTSMMSSLPRVLPELIGSFAGLSDEDKHNILYLVNLLVKAQFGISSLSSSRLSPTTDDKDTTGATS